LKRIGLCKPVNGYEKIISKKIAPMKTIKLLLILIFCLLAAKSLWAQIKVMPLGDSITYDNRITETRPVGQRTAYRQPLYLYLKDDGYDVDFVGSQIAGQDAAPSFDPDNEGHPGWQADGDPGGENIAPKIYNWLSDHPADIILLHIGTNDISGGQDPAGVASEIAQILDEIDRYETDKGVKVWVILARIISRTDSMASATTTFNNQIQPMVDARKGDNIIVVDMEHNAGLIYMIDQSSPYYGGDMYDRLHPNVSGYEKMAALWLADGLLTILPQADAGTDQNVDEKTFVTLDGSWSVDPDAPDGNPSPLDYLWAQQSGTSVELSNPTAQKPTFTAPAVGLSGEKLEFQLTVTDIDGFEHSNSVFINVNNVLIPPSVDAGSDQNVVAGRAVTLDGSNSLDPDDPGGTFPLVQWEQISGKNQITLTTPAELTTNFTAPTVDSEGDQLTFKLTVEDSDGLSSSDTVTVIVTVPEAPVADAGADQSAAEGETVTLNGLDSHDPDGTISLVQWKQISGKNQVILTTPNELTTKFTAPATDSDGDVLTFNLTVEDNDGLASEDIVSVTITSAANSTANSDGGGSGGGGCFIQTVVN
jgi:lysophospholipase L1-like esterase